MPSLVNRVPPGLLSLLGIKAGGQNPAILPDTLQPTLELLELYIAGNAQETLQLTSAVNLPGIWGIVSPAPGPGEIYYVERFSVGILSVLAAGTVYRVQPAIYDASAANKVWTFGPPVSAAAGEIFNCASDRPFILPAGYRLAAMVSQYTAGTPVQMRVAARYVPLSI